MRVRSRISELCKCMGIINTLSKLQILIFIIHIENLLINSLYGATETFASWFEMAFKHCVLEVTFHVNGLDMTYANIWQSKRDMHANMIANWHTINSKVNKSNRVKSRITLDKTTSLQVKSI